MSEGRRRGAERLNLGLPRSSTIEAAVQRHVLGPWLPRSIDVNGGFQQDFGRDWMPLGAGLPKDLVYQSRLTWTAATAAVRYPDHAADFLAATQHGLDWLLEYQRDGQDGGFFWSVDRSGSPTGIWGREKHAYGISFALFALVASYSATADENVLEQALNTFDWLETHFLDHSDGGYFEVSMQQRDLPSRGARRNDAIGTPYGFKSSNTHLHLLEAFTELYSVSSSPRVRVRLEALLTLILSKLILADGSLAAIYGPGWMPVAAPHSFGHEFETAYLIHTAAISLYGSVDAATGAAEQALMSSALNGLGRRGGVNHLGVREGDITDARRIWWVQAEALNALSLFGGQPGVHSADYRTAFVELWTFIAKFQTDHKYGGWYAELTARNRPIRRNKSDGWTDPYHQMRALTLVHDRLQKQERAMPLTF